MAESAIPAPLPNGCGRECDVLSRQPGHYRYLFHRMVGRWSGPKVLLASPPKTGTNLLHRILMLAPGLRYGGYAVGDPVVDKDWHLREIAKIRPGEILVTHLWWSPELESTIQDNDVRGVFMIRDPRDVCVSNLHHIQKMKDHWCHDYFQTLLDQDTRLMACIRGLNVQLSSGQRLYLESIYEHFDLRSGYINHSRFTTATFESLIGAQGGGSFDRQKEVIQRVTRHLGLHLTARQCEFVAANAFSSESPTFRRGRIGAWREEFTPEHKAAFKEVAGELLVSLGYESDLDW